MILFSSNCKWSCFQVLSLFATDQKCPCSAAVNSVTASMYFLPFSIHTESFFFNRFCIIVIIPLHLAFQCLVWISILPSCILVIIVLLFCSVCVMAWSPVCVMAWSPVCVMAWSPVCVMAWSRVCVMAWSPLCVWWHDHLCVCDDMITCVCVMVWSRVCDGMISSVCVMTWSPLCVWWHDHLCVWWHDHLCVW